MLRRKNKGRKGILGWGWQISLLERVARNGLPRVILEQRPEREQRGSSELNNEVLNNSVECDARIEILRNKALEVCNRFGSNVRIKANQHLAEVLNVDYNVIRGGGTVCNTVERING